MHFNHDSHSMCLYFFCFCLFSIKLLFDLYCFSLFVSHSLNSCQLQTTHCLKARHILLFALPFLHQINVIVNIAFLSSICSIRVIVIVHIDIRILFEICLLRSFRDGDCDMQLKSKQSEFGFCNLIIIPSFCPFSL